MSLQTRLEALVVAIGADIKARPRKFSGLFGNGTSTVLAITHSLNNSDVQVSVWGPTSGYTVLSVVITNDNVVTVTFDVAPPTSSVRVVVVA